MLLCPASLLFACLHTHPLNVSAGVRKFNAISRVCLRVESNAPFKNWNPRNICGRPIAFFLIANCNKFRFVVQHTLFKKHTRISICASVLLLQMLNRKKISRKSIYQKSRPISLFSVWKVDKKLIFWGEKFDESQKKKINFKVYTCTL